MRPEVARDALLATHGGLSLEMVCGDLPHLAHGPLSPRVCSGSAESGHGIGQVSLTPAGYISWPMKNTADA